MVVVPQVAGFLYVGVGIGLLRPVGALEEVPRREPGHGVAVAGGGGDGSVEMNHRGDAPAGAGKGGGDGGVPRQDVT